jgi:hypothetical protein
MAVENVTYLLAVQYDESKDDIRSTYGVSNAELKEVFELFSNEEAVGKSYTSRMIELINAGKISGGLLLLLATKQIMKAIEMAVMQQNLSAMQQNLSAMLRKVLESNEDNPFGLPPDEDTEN